LFVLREYLGRDIRIITLGHISPGIARALKVRNRNPTGRESEAIYVIRNSDAFAIELYDEKAGERIQDMPFIRFTSTCFPRSSSLGSEPLQCIVIDHAERPDAN
jgi:hypothetical protein